MSRLVLAFALVVLFGCSGASGADLGAAHAADTVQAPAPSADAPTEAAPALADDAGPTMPPTPAEAAAPVPGDAAAVNPTPDAGAVPTVVLDAVPTVVLDAVPTVVLDAVPTVVLDAGPVPTVDAGPAPATCTPVNNIYDVQETCDVGAPGTGGGHEYLCTGQVFPDVYRVDPPNTPECLRAWPVPTTP